MKTKTTHKVTKVLIVEDELILAQLYKQVLKRMQIQTVGIATNAQDALNLIEANKPDLIFMDIMIDGHIDGIDTAKLIQQKFNIPVVYLSASTDPENKKRLEQTNYIDFLTKPVDVSDIKALFSKFI